MHDAIREAWKEWHAKNGPFIQTAKIAELGSQDVNGTIKDYIPQSIGFDIIEAKGVDIVIKDGWITAEHRQAYDLVVSISSFQFCPDPHMYMNEILALLKPGGILFLTMCGVGCIHMDDHIRLSKEAIECLFSKFFDIEEIRVLEESIHKDVILVARLKHDAN